MSGLTVELLEGKPRKRRPTRWSAKFEEIADRLVAAYGVPTLGNYSDPVQEIFYILLSAKTADGQYRRTNAAILSRFPTLRQLSEAPQEEIVKCIKSGGIGNLKATRIKQIASTLIEDFGDRPSAHLRRLSARDVYAYLTALPGVGPKSALCIMMCSLNFDVFPVDVNVSRIAVRLGAIPQGRKHYHYQELLPLLIPDRRSKELHVGLVVHGRTVCLPRNPKCGSCLIRDLCAFGKQVSRQAQ